MAASFLGSARHTELLVMPNAGSSGLDVLGPNGEYVYVGGGAKAADPSRF
ncbi:hypothetical protein [Streptomyces lavendofoliae]|uniref:Uncharacterized protein n=1 Tax=Streptomyces lavendofoliae TaxID=67314 RepID=A0A918M7F4_9ACTN|nr:hypothetical protein [Streptomyces lavendofoliae]GGU65626.1 hypothetical protein GCM10010274_62920 [Streptomyces lavendofoliae]